MIAVFQIILLHLNKWLKKDLPDEEILLVELICIKNQKFLGIPEHQGILLHTESAVYSLDQYEDAIHLAVRTPTQFENYMAETKFDTVKVI